MNTKYNLELNVNGTWQVESTHRSEAHAERAYERVQKLVVGRLEHRVVPAA